MRLVMQVIIRFIPSITVCLLPLAHKLHQMLLVSLSSGLWSIDLAVMYFSYMFTVQQLAQCWPVVKNLATDKAPPSLMAELHQGYVGH